MRVALRDDLHDEIGRALQSLGFPEAPAPEAAPAAAAGHLTGAVVIPSAQRVPYWTVTAWPTVSPLHSGM